MAARMPMIATTIINSMSVKPRWLPNLQRFLFQKLNICPPPIHVVTSSGGISPPRAAVQRQCLPEEEHRLCQGAELVESGSCGTPAPRLSVILRRVGDGNCHRWAPSLPELVGSTPEGPRHP